MLGRAELAAVVLAGFIEALSNGREVQGPEFRIVRGIVGDTWLPV